MSKTKRKFSKTISFQSQNKLLFLLCFINYSKEKIYILFYCCDVNFPLCLCVRRSGSYFSWSGYVFWKVPSNLFLPLTTQVFMFMYTKITKDLIDFTTSPPNLPNLVRFFFSATSSPCGALSQRGTNTQWQFKLLLTQI